MGRVRIWRQQHESMDATCLVSTVQTGGGVMVWRKFSWHTLGPLIPINHCLNTTTYLNIVADHVNPIMATMDHLLMATSCMAFFPVTGSESNRTPLGSDRMGDMLTNQLKLQSCQNGTEPQKGVSNIF